MVSRFQQSMRSHCFGYYLARTENYQDDINYKMLDQMVYPCAVLVDNYIPPLETDITRIDIGTISDINTVKKMAQNIADSKFNSSFLYRRENYNFFMKNARGTLYVSDFTNLGDSFEEILFTLADLRRFKVDVKVAAWEGKAILRNSDLFDALMMFFGGSQIGQGYQGEKGIILSTAPEKKTMGKRGQPPIERPSNWNEVISRKNKGEITTKEAMEELHLKRSTFYNMLKKYGN